MSAGRVRFTADGSAIKLSPNVERVADEATNIAECASKLNKHPPLPEVSLIVPIRAHALSMFKHSIDAFVREDVELARAVVSRDKQLDDMIASANRQLSERMMQDGDRLRGYLNVILISRCLERVADHATNIAEDPFMPRQPRTSGIKPDDYPFPVDSTCQSKLFNRDWLASNHLDRDLPYN